MPRQTTLALVTALTLLTSAVPATAQDADDELRKEEGWEFRLTPYLWTLALEGDVAAFGAPPASVDLSFSDLFDALDLALAGVFEARKGRWLLITDLSYMELSQGGQVTFQPPPGFEIELGTEIGMDSLLLTVAGGFRAHDGPRTKVDALLLARYVDMDLSLAIDPRIVGGPPGPGRMEIHDSASWVDPMVGVRAAFEASPKTEIQILANIGGFGVGSDLGWEVGPAVLYDFSTKISGLLAYRYMDFDYEEDGFLFDGSLQGLFLGVRFSFGGAAG